MVKALLGFSLALAVPAATQPITVEVVAIGHAVTPADHFTFQIQLEATAKDQQAADAKLAALRAIVIARITQAGARVDEADGSDDMTVTIASPTDEAAAMLDNTVDDAVPSAGSALVIVADTAAAMDRARAAVKDVDGVSSDGRLTASLVDPSAATAVARDDALAKARVQAARYAGKLDLPRITLVKISEQIDLGSLIMMSDGKGPPPTLRKSVGNDVVTDIPMTVTFRLDAKP